MTEDKPTKKRKSRFDDAGFPPPAATSAVNPPAVDPSVAIAKATEISKNILNATLNNASSSTPVLSVEQQNAIKAAEMQAQLAAQIASVSHLLKNVQQQQLSSQQQTNPLLSSTSNLTAQIQQVIKEKKTSYRPLLLDSQGREIDEQGNLVKSDFTQVKTLAVNNQIVQAQRKKENPYLAHRQIPQTTLPTQPPIQINTNLALNSTDIIGTNAVTSSTQMTVNSLLFQPALVTAAGAVPTAEVSTAPLDNKFIDERVVIGDRSIRSKKALKFHEPGKYIQKEEEEHLKEERKIIAGYASGRKTLGISGAASKAVEEDTAMEEDDEADMNFSVTLTGDNSSSSSGEEVLSVPRPIDDGVVPSMEWWDELLLPKPTRENRKK